MNFVKKRKRNINPYNPTLLMKLTFEVLGMLIIILFLAFVVYESQSEEVQFRRRPVKIKKEESGKNKFNRLSWNNSGNNLNKYLDNPENKNNLIAEWNNCEKQEYSIPNTFIRLTDVTDLQYEEVVKFVTTYKRNPEEFKL